MNNSFSKMVEIIILINFMFIMPVMYFFLKQDYINYMYAYDKTVRFVDNIRNVGYINDNILKKYYKELSLMNKTYEIHMDCIEYVPIYDDSTNKLYSREKRIDLINMEEYVFNKNDYLTVKIIIYGKYNKSFIIYGGSIKDDIRRYKEVD